jgi:hypothetical protein
MIIQNPLLTGSLNYNGADLSNVTSSNANSASVSLILTAVSSSNQQLSASYIALSGSYNTFSGSASTRVTKIENNYATTGSNSFRADQSITGSLVVSSTITAQTLVVQTVTSSILYSSGSNNFGNQLINTQTFTGSVNITGSNHTIFGNVGIGTSSPSYNLDVTGTGRFTGATNFGNTLTITNSSITGVGIYLDGTAYSGHKWALGDGIVTNTVFSIKDITSGTEGFRLTSAGAATFSSSVTAQGINSSVYGLTIGNFDGQAIKLQEGTATGNSYLRFYNSAGGALGYLGSFNNSGTQYTLLDGSTTDLTLNGNANVYLQTAGTNRLTITSTGAATFLSVDSSGNRTTLNDVLTITQTNPSVPYSGFGSGILFKGTTYNSGGSGIPGIRNWGRIAMQLTDNSVSTAGENMLFQVAPADNSDTLNTALTLASTGAATFSSSVTATQGNFQNSGYGLPLNVLGNSGYSANLYSQGGTGAGWNDIRATNTGGGVWFGVMRNDGAAPFSGGTGYAGYIGTNNATDFIITSNSTPRISITSGGSIGIGGVTNAVAAFHITTTATGTPTIPSLGNINSYVAQYITNGAGGGSYGLMTGTLYTGNAWMQVQRSDGTASAYNLIMQPNGGNVGISTTNPASKLSMGGAVSQSAPLTYTPSEARQGFFNTYYSNSESLFPQYLDIVSYGQPDGTNGGGIIRFLTNPVTNASAAVERMRLSAGGYLKLKTVSSVYTTTTHRLDDYQLAEGSTVLVSGNANSADTILLYSVSQAGQNAAATALGVGKNSSTSRSINAGGSINASGADYAEYMVKAITDNIAKGDIVGINSEGKLTNIFNDAISFVVKSTDPAYVGNDTWGSVGALNKPISLYTEEELQQYKATNEAIRTTVDRIAFSGQVPCNVTGANVGDYIIPIELENEKISGQAVTNPTFEQYQISVGKVWKIMEDGRAWIAVKIG